MYHSLYNNVRVRHITNFRNMSPLPGPYDVELSHFSGYFATHSIAISPYKGTRVCRNSSHRPVSDCPSIGILPIVRT